MRRFAQGNDEPLRLLPATRKGGKRAGFSLPITSSNPTALMLDVQDQSARRAALAGGECKAMDRSPTSACIRHQKGFSQKPFVF
jgi:hypothetical protein